MAGLCRHRGTSAAGRAKDFTDSSSAPPLSVLQGPGRVKHVEALLLAQQDWRQQGRINVVKCATVDNLSDPFTKYVTKAIIAVSFLSFWGGGGREGSEFAHDTLRGDALWRTALH